MTIEISKLAYGAIVGPGEGITVSKLSYGALVGPDPGIAVSKITYGVIVDALTIPAGGRRRQIVN